MREKLCAFLTLQTFINYALGENQETETGTNETFCFFWECNENKQTSLVKAWSITAYIYMPNIYLSLNYRHTIFWSSEVNFI